MVYAAAALFILISLIPVHSEASEKDEICGILLQLKRLSLQSTDPGLENLTTAQTKTRRDNLLGALRLAATEGYISGQDINRLEADVRSGASASTDRLITRNHCIRDLHPAPQSVNGIGVKLKADAVGSAPVMGQTKASPALPGGSRGLVIAAIAACLSSLLALTWLLERLRRLRQMRVCGTKALLVYGENCTVSTLTKIGQRGAQLQAPRVDIPKKGLDLYVAGHHIAAKRQWGRRFFLGLDFVHPISAEAVEAIVRSSSVREQLEGIEKNATPCFFPGCHHNCEHHRITAIMDSGNA